MAHGKCIYIIDMESLTDMLDRFFHTKNLSAVFQKDPSRLQSQIHNPLRIRFLSQILLQVNHVCQQHTIFINFFPVIFRKKSRHDMRRSKTAVFIKANRLFAVSRSHIHGKALETVLLAHIVKQGLSVSSALRLFSRSNIF